MLLATFCLALGIGCWGLARAVNNTDPDVQHQMGDPLSSLIEPAPAGAAGVPEVPIITSLHVIEVVVHGEGMPPMQHKGFLGFSRAAVCSAQVFSSPILRLAALRAGPFLAQASPANMVNEFLNFLAVIFLVIGAILIANGGYQLHQGRIPEALLSILGGLVLAMAIPLMRYFLRLAGINV